MTLISLCLYDKKKEKEKKNRVLLQIIHRERPEVRIV